MPDTEEITPKGLAYFKALADATRLRLLAVLSRHELNVNELVLILEMGQSRISRHLKILSSSGLLTWRREGLWVFYSTAQSGRARTFIDAVRPFMDGDPALKTDLDMAAGMIEERVHKTRQFFNAIAEDWDKLSREVLGAFDLAEAVARYMPPCAVAADLGCGTGNVLSAMLAKAGTVIGVDGSPRMLELARRRFSKETDRVSMRIGDLSHLPLADGEAEFVSLNMVLHHIPQPVAVLEEIRRVLSPSGRLVLTDFNRHEYESMRHEYGDHWLGFDRESLHGFLERAGFRVQESRVAPVERGLSLHIIVADNNGKGGG
ncbi:MAG: metalloregulator ArsR/SmtB family transcription factor [Desulfovibrio sp.]|jgi:ArsR family transcriptional regulator|nr:metalloregulator ArsR/SmtB family transcription factor [Desulfovibrio sp.]